MHYLHDDSGQTGLIGVTARVETGQQRLKHQFYG